MSEQITQSLDFNALKQGKFTKTRYAKPEAVKILEQLALDNLKKRYPNNPYHPKPKYTDATTNGLTKCVITYVTLLGQQAERINSTGTLKDNRKTSRDVLGRTRTIGSTKWIPGSGQTGTADISATINGFSVKIEIKNQYTGDDKQSKGQIAYQKQIEASKGVYLIVRNFTDFYDWLNEFLNL